MSVASGSPSADRPQTAGDIPQQQGGSDTLSTRPLLNDDALLLIFTINSHALDGTFDASELALIDPRGFPPALENNRVSSQVCQQWRRVALSSTVIWANAINLAFLNQRSDNWREEVMNRTGEALLTVVSGPFWTGRRSGKEQKRRRLLIKLLETGWHRIARLVVAVEEIQVAKSLCALARQRRASTFRLVAISGKGVFNYTLNWYKDPLFRGASQLHHFRFDALEPARARGRWPSSILHLSLSAVPTVDRLLEILRGVPQLQTVKIGPLPIGRMEATDIPVVNMRCLEYMSLIQPDTPTSVLVEILSHIVPARGCEVRIQTEVRLGDGAEVPAFCGTYFNFVQHSHPFSEMQHLNLALLPIDAWKIPITKVLYALLASKNKGVEFRADLDCTRAHNFDMAPNTFVGRLASSDLSGVITVALYLPDDNRAFSPTDPDIQRLLARLTGVRRLGADCSTLRFLALTQYKAQAVLLPNMKTIKLGLGNFDVISLLMFLSTRTAKNIPVRKIIIPIEGQANLELAAVLKRYENLKVEWVGNQVETHGHLRMRLRHIYD